LFKIALFAFYGDYAFDLPFFDCDVAFREEFEAQWEEMVDKIKRKGDEVVFVFKERLHFFKTRFFEECKIFDFCHRNILAQNRLRKSVCLL